MMNRLACHVVSITKQPPPASLAETMDRVLMVINTAERLPILSEGIISAAREGEPYEVLLRKIETLHNNLESLALLSAKAKVSELPESKASPHKEAKDQLATSLEVGSVLYSSWGYEQTNVDWYQVIEVKKSRKTIVVRQVAANNVENGFMAGKSTPVIDQFIGDPMTKRVNKNNGIKVEHTYAGLWDGLPKYISWYG